MKWACINLKHAELEARLAKAEQRAYNQNLEALKEKQRGDIAEAQRDEAVRVLTCHYGHGIGWCLSSTVIDEPCPACHILAEPWAQEAEK